MYINLSELASAFLVGLAMVIIIRSDGNWFVIAAILGGLYIIDTLKAAH